MRGEQLQTIAKEVMVQPLKSSSRSKNCSFNRNCNKVRAERIYSIAIISFLANGASNAGTLRKQNTRPSGGPVTDDQRLRNPRPYVVVVKSGSGRALCRMGRDELLETVKQPARFRFNNQ